MRQTLATLATLACARAWPALDEALRAYPGKHAAAVAQLEKGQDAKVVLVGAHHGLGNREHALLSSFGLALPSARVMKAVDAALARSRGCGVGVHLRKKGQDWRAGDVWPRLRREVEAHEGGLLVGSDGHSAWLKRDLIALAKADNVSIVRCLCVQSHISATTRPHVN